MKRRLDVLNLLGVLLLAFLCAGQWSTNSQLQKQLKDSGTQERSQAKTICDQLVLLTERQADLEEFRQRLSVSEAALAAAKLQFMTMTHQRDAAEVQISQLQTAGSQWQAAVSARDAIIHKAGEQISSLTGQRDDAITEYRGLAARYNALVEHNNATRPSRE